MTSGLKLALIAFDGETKYPEIVLMFLCNYNP